jgi:hypothetical protein
MRHSAPAAATAVAALASALLPSYAHADPPLVVEEVVFDGTPELDEGLSDLCGFPVTSTATGHFTGTVYFDSDGEFRVFTGRPSFRQTFTSPYATVETSDRGIDKTTVTQDGDVLIFGTGIHLRVKGTTSAVGLWRLTVDAESGELVAEEYYGNFDVTVDEIGPLLCELLGPEEE